MSYSFAFCAAVILSNACFASFCAAAMLGCFFALTFTLGFANAVEEPSTNIVASMIFFIVVPLVVFGRRRRSRRARTRSNVCAGHVAPHGVPSGPSDREGD